ncbi:CHAT domain-containing protein [Actinoplanes sp. NPDC051513]|uniref:CHAT domain-containing protein n=1 Tax=Actinoplanes sp. NPDC051513 TaxID=3363908 RepID=UPI00379563A8
MGQPRGVEVPQSVVDAVEAFVNTAELSEKRAILETHAEDLLGEYADPLLAVLIAQYGADPEVAGGIEADRALLLESRERGVAEAFGARLHRDRERAVTPEVLADLAGLRDEPAMAAYLASRPAVREVLMAAVVAYVDTKTGAGLRSVLRREADLLRTPPAEFFVRGIAGTDPHLNALANLLSYARQHGVEAAVEAALGPADEQPPVSGSREVDDIVNELLFTDDHLGTERRLELARRGLALIEAGSSLWALFHSVVGETLLETYGTDRADRVDEALDHHRAVLAWAQERDNVTAAASAHTNLAGTFLARVHGSRAENVAEAVAQARQAVAGFDPAEHARDAARARALLADALEAGLTGNLAEAHEQAHAALELSTDPAVTVGIYQTLARIADRGGPDDHHDRGLTYLRESVALVDRATNPDNWARAAMEFARVAALQETATSETSEDALAALQDALALTDRDRRPVQWAQVHALLATAYRWRPTGDPADNYAQAIEHGERALTVFTPGAFPDQWAEAAGELADAYRLSLYGNPITTTDDAVALYSTLVEFYRARGDARQWARIETKIAAALLANRFGTVERLAVAERHYRAALAELDRLGDSWAAGAHIGLVGVGQRRIQAGETAVTAELLDNLRIALAAYTRRDHPDEYVQVRLAGMNLRLTMADRGDRPEHVAAAAELLDEARAAVTPRTEVDVFRARVDLAETGIERAAAFEEIIGVGERLLGGTTTEASQQQILPALSRAYACLAFDMLERGRTAEALTLVEQGRARVLLDVLDPGPDDLPEPARGRVERARRQIEQIRNALNAPPVPGRPSDAQLGRTLALARRELANALAGVTPDRPDTAAPVGAVLVVPLVCAYGVALFVLSPGASEPAVVRLEIERHAVQDAEVRWLTAAAQLELGRLRLDQLTELMQEITGWLWTAVAGPLEERLEQLGVPAETPLRIVSSPLSRLFPLHAAWHTEGGRHRALIEDRIISYAPSTQLLRQAIRRRDQPSRAGRRALLLADSTGDLPNALDEVRAIAALTDADVFTGEAATRAALLRNTAGHGLVHVACHAAVNWFQPHHSVVELADGYAYAAELAGLDLAAARLVVLSACQSAVTEPDPAAGEYTGLAAALLRAGAPAVIATLWNVNDLASSLLMRRFYDGLVRRAMPPDAALREAQLWLRSVTVAELATQEASPKAARRWRLLAETPAETPYASPYFWAGYVLVGA